MHWQMGIFRGVVDLPGDIAAIAPKIARGENYLGLPYVMLDYPRYFRPAIFWQCVVFSGGVIFSALRCT